MPDIHESCNVYLKSRCFKDLSPMDCGWQRCRPGHSYGPAIRDYYLIHYVRSGTGIFRNERGEYTVHAGQLFVIRPGEVTYYKASDKTPWYYSWIGVVGELAAVWDGAPDVISKDCSSYFDAMEKSGEYERGREEFVTGQLYLMIAELFGEKGEKRPSPDSFASRAANYIDSHYMDDISVERLAKELIIDRRYLSRLFRREYGVTAKEYIIAARMKRAKTFLEDGYTVGKCAAMCGYPDVFNFSRMFKKYYGVSPSSVLQKGRKM